MSQTLQGAKADRHLELVISATASTIDCRTHCKGKLITKQSRTGLQEAVKLANCGRRRRGGGRHYRPTRANTRSQCDLSLDGQENRLPVNLSSCRRTVSFFSPFSFNFFIFPFLPLKLPHHPHQTDIYHRQSNFAAATVIQIEQREKGEKMITAYRWIDCTFPVCLSSKGILI